jgi:hypothetical protein
MIHAELKRTCRGLRMPESVMAARLCSKTKHLVLPSPLCGRSNSRETPMPRGSRPSTAALTSEGATKASDSSMVTRRVLQVSRMAIPSMVTEPAVISASQRRPVATEEISFSRVSARAGRESVVASGTMISRHRRIEVLRQGIAIVAVGSAESGRSASSGTLSSTPGSSLGKCGDEAPPSWRL